VYEIIHLVAIEKRAPDYPWMQVFKASRAVDDFILREDCWKIASPLDLANYN
jgi:hypothetical protein